MKVIQIKYIPMSATRQPRLKAFTDHASMIESRDYEIAPETQAKMLVSKFMADNGYGHLFVTGFGQLPNGDYVATIGSNKIKQALERVIEYHVPKINPLSDAAILSAMQSLRDE